MKTRRLQLLMVLMLFVILSFNNVNAQNTMIINNKTALPSSVVEIELAINNADAFVAFQLDVPLPSGFTYVDASLVLNPARITNHDVSGNVVASNTLRIISHSATNAAYLGNSGVVVTFQVNAPASEGAYTFNIVDGYIVNAGGTNIITGTTSGTITLAKGTPTVDAWPTASTITYGDQLSASTLSGGSASYDGSPVAGTFAFIAPTTVPNAGTYVASVRFTPTNTTLYNTVDGTVNVTVNQRSITVAADAKTKVYGDADPAFTYQLTVGSLVGTDALTGTATRTAGENVGIYLINQGGVTVTPNPGNYIITWTSANLTITERPITITAQAKTKTYGEVDPALTYVLSSGSLATGDSWTGALTRNPGEDVGVYAILRGTLAPTNEANYNITYVPANLTITLRAITITADAKTKVYGDADPVLTYQLSSGTLATGDSWTGTLTRAAGENIGNRQIQIGTLAPTNAGNYTITYNPANLTITARPITITADAKTKVYGDVDPALTYQITAGALQFSDEITGAITRAAGNNVGTYAITQGTLTISPLATNYNITFVGANFTITAKGITVTATAGQTKVYGAADPVFAYTAIGVVGGDTPTGALARAAGEDVGIYAINIGTLSYGSNYTVTFVPADFTITAKAITITANAGQAKVYGTADPVFTYTAIGVVGVDTPTGALDRAAGEDVGIYAINIGTLSYGSNYSVSFVPANFTITEKALTITVDAGQTKVYGAADPVFTYTATGVVGTDTPTGALGRAPGNNVGTYAINIGTLSYGSNYTVTFVPANFSITAKDITVTANAGQTKVYGSADPVFTYTATGVVGADTPSGALSRITPSVQAVGTYAITQGTLTYGSNYTITFVPNDFTITAKALTITADNQIKPFGEEFVFNGNEFIAVGLAYTDVVTNATITSAGADAAAVAGTYPIIIGNAIGTGLTNYTITYVEGVFTVSDLIELSLSGIVADNKIYDGEVDAVISNWGTLVGVAGADDVTLDTSSAIAFFHPNGDAGNGKIIRITGLALDGPDAGKYFIGMQETSANITPRDLTLDNFVADNKVYDGTTDAFGTSFNDDRVIGDNLEFTYDVAFANANVGVGIDVDFTNILISGGTDQNNYNLVTIAGLASADITAKLLSVQAEAKSKVYGDLDPAFTYIVTGLAAGDDLSVMSGELDRAAGEDVGAYEILIGSLTAGDNYTIDYTAENLTITAKSITVTADAGQEKIYGEVDPIFAYTAVGVVGTDTPSGALGRQTGENIGTYAILIGTLSYGSNYTIVFISSDFEITQREALVTANPMSKVYGSADPVFTYTATNIVGGDSPTGALSRVAGEDVGTYEITEGTLSYGANYLIVFTSDDLTISPKELTLTANDITKAFGTEYVFTGNEFTANGLVFSDGIESATLASDGAAIAAVAGAYEITISDAVAEGATDLANYNITYVPGSMEVVDKIPLTLEGIIAQSKVYDGETNAIITDYGFLMGVEGGDDVTVNIDNVEAHFANKNVGIDKVVSLTGFVLEGIDADKYFLGTQTTTANITVRNLTLSNFVADDKEYDATTDVTGDGFDDDRVVGDLLEFTYNVAFANPNAGTEVVVSFSDIVISGGADMNNYTLVTTFGSAIADIFAKEVVVTPDAGQFKIFGDIDPVLTYTYNVGDLFGGDEITGSLSREVGEDVGEYAILIGTLTASSNYFITLTPEVFNIFPDEQFDLILIANPIEGGTVTGDGTYNAGTLVPIQATANEGYSFENWKIEETIVSLDAAFDYLMPGENVTLTATFILDIVPTFDVTLEALPAEGGTLTGAGAYEEGEEVTVEAVANEGYSFVNWTNVAEEEVATTAAYVFNMPAENTHLIANFEINVHTLTLVANPVAGGTVTGGGDYAFGTSVEVTAVPAAEYVFENWTIGATVVSTDAIFNYVMPDNDVTLTANFSEIPPVTYTLTLVADPVEGGTVDGAGNYEEGAEVTVTANANTDFTFNGWYLGETLASESASFTFDMPAENMTLTAKFGQVSITSPEIINISVYPNPSRGNVSITSDSMITEVKVVDMIGKVVYTAKPESTIIDLALTVEPGMYFIIIYTEAGQKTMKLQINK